MVGGGVAHLGQDHVVPHAFIRLDIFQDVQLAGLP